MPFIQSFQMALNDNFIDFAPILFFFAIVTLIKCMAFQAPARLDFSSTTLTEGVSAPSVPAGDWGGLLKELNTGSMKHYKTLITMKACTKTLRL